MRDLSLHVCDMSFCQAQIAHLWDMSLCSSATFTRNHKHKHFFRAIRSELEDVAVVLWKRLKSNARATATCSRVVDKRSAVTTFRVFGCLTSCKSVVHMKPITCNKSWPRMTVTFIVQRKSHIGHLCCATLAQSKNILCLVTLTNSVRTNSISLPGNASSAASSPEWWSR
jgi:hypothetical protein